MSLSNENNNDDDNNNVDKYQLSFAGNSLEAASMAHGDNNPVRPITTDDLVCLLRFSFVLFVLHVLKISNSQIQHLLHGVVLLNRLTIW